MSLVALSVDMGKNNVKEMFSFLIDEEKLSMLWGKEDTFTARAARLPLLNPYKDTDANFKHGVDFAVAGSTALPVDTLGDKNISENKSLGVQLDWMSTHFKSNCDNDTDCEDKLKYYSLFMVGEIGDNEYNYALLQGNNIEEVKRLVPSIVQAIANVVRRAVSYGAVRVVVPGNFPIGCFPIYLTRFKTDNSTAYDENKCLKDLNELSRFHNHQLQQAIHNLNEELNEKFTDKFIRIVYGDYYNAFEWVFNNAADLGFDPSTTQKSCGFPPICGYPSKFIGWDGIHLAQEAYRRMTDWLLWHDLPFKLRCTL